MQVIAHSATARSTERLKLPLRRVIFEKPEQENIETENCQALVHMDTCDPNVVLVLVVYVQYSTSTMYTLVLALRIR